jgi:glucan biosynthesis protein C
VTNSISTSVPSVHALKLALASGRVQSLRGIACFLLVAFHVVGTDSAMGMHVGDNSGYRIFANLLIHLRMPLFTCLSGYVYAYRPVRAGELVKFGQKKLWRLYVPLLTAASIYFLMQAMTPSVNIRTDWSDVWRIYFFPYAHFWFLQAILLIFAVVTLLERAQMLMRFDRYLLMLVGAFAAHFFLMLHPNFFSVQQACYLLPFFMIGLGANRFAEKFSDPATQAVALSIFILTMALHVLACFGIWGEVSAQRTLLATSLSTSGLIVLIHRMPPVRQLIWIGNFSFTIYLYHVLFTAGARIGMIAAGLHNSMAIFIVGLICGVAGPIGMELVLKRNATSTRLLLGQSGRKASSEA